MNYQKLIRLVGKALEVIDHGPGVRGDMYLKIRQPIKDIRTALDDEMRSEPAVEERVDAKEFFKQKWGTQPLTDPEIKHAVNLLTPERLFTLMEEFRAARASSGTGLRAEAQEMFDAYCTGPLDHARLANAALVLEKILAGDALGVDAALKFIQRGQWVHGYKYKDENNIEQEQIFLCDSEKLDYVETLDHFFLRWEVQPLTRKEFDSLVSLRTPAQGSYICTNHQLVNCPNCARGATGNDLCPSCENVIDYVREEVRRQGHDVEAVDGLERVAWMLQAWTWAVEASTNGKPNAIDAMILGEKIEPDKNSITPRTVGVRVGSRVCPHPQELQRLIDRLFENRDAMTPLEFYKEFELIHPFVDGNGRTGKVLLNWLNGTLLDPIFPPSDIFGHPIQNP